MLINLNSLNRYKDKVLSEDMEFTDEQLNIVETFKKVNFCHVDAKVEDFDDIIRIEVKVKAEVVMSCAYTLEDVTQKLDIDDFFDFSTNEAYEDDEEIFYIDSNEITLEPYILSLLITECPSKVIKEGATLPSGGKDYEVITEEEYERRKENRVDPRFAALDNLDIDN